MNQGTIKTSPILFMTKNSEVLQKNNPKACKMDNCETHPSVWHNGKKQTSVRWIQKSNFHIFTDCQSNPST